MPLRPNPVRPVGWMAATALVAVGLTGCSALTPGAPAGREVSVEQGSKLSAADVAALGDVTLRVTDGGDASPDSLISRSIAQFEADFPNVTIEREVKAFEDYTKTINLVMSDEDAPDLADVDSAMAPRLVAGQLIRPLDDYYAEYGWEERYPAGILSALKVDETGKTYGTGSYWGATLGGQIVGVYYNAAKLEELGLEPAESLEDFEADLATIAEAGEIPIQLGNLDQWSGSHVFSTLLSNIADPEALQAWINGQPDTTFETPEITAALERFQTWAERGYISDQANGTLDDDAVAAFAEGEGVFLITGSWRTADLDEALGDDGGYMLLPPQEEGGTSYATGTFGQTYGISSKSENADLAAFFLDYLAGPKTAELALAGGGLPFTGEMTTDAGPITQDVLNAWNTALQNDALVGYLDSAAPAMGDTLFPALQELMAGRRSAEDVAASVQETWESYRQGS